ncbi:alpha/beta hydrolase [Mucilaginibacter arboris]|uniref:Alpha/beta hydrolase fold domain-containing protein n=1 Tax=Mucilaginibacter arboris TaxID=2682090 RepID=A0A7K1SW92_9SPHI|nr:alpha/beta hydrolase [Mucilaginibacter arboris]MVN21586.1 alpha/beta hydrolase fold domain-containing protein [Mucilaginibacter arboris]
MKYLLSFLLLLYFLPSQAQLTSGLTQKPDTSYTNYSAFQSTRKKYPNIILVKEASLPGVQEKRNLVYCSLKNRNLYLDAFYPKAGKRKLPAILIIFGGGWRSGNRAQQIPLAQRLASKGYVCFTADYRLSTEALYPAAVYDLKSALRWMHANATKFNIDTTKIAVLGFSAGGELAALLGTTRQNPAFEGSDPCNNQASSNVNAVVDIDGILSFVHPESGEGNDTKSISASTYWFGYTKMNNFNLLKEASPLTHVGKNTPPFLFLNSSVDRMHAGRDDFRKILDEYHIYSEVHSFPDSPHGFCMFEPWFTPTVDYIVGFLGKVL